MNDAKVEQEVEELHAALVPHLQDCMFTSVLTTVGHIVVDTFFQQGYMEEAESMEEIDCDFVSYIHWVRGLYASRRKEFESSGATH